MTVICLQNNFCKAQIFQWAIPAFTEGLGILLFTNIPTSFYWFRFIGFQIPAGTSSHTRIRLAGKGIARTSSYGHGDHYVNVKIRIPGWVVVSLVKIRINILTLHQIIAFLTNCFEIFMWHICKYCFLFISYLTVAFLEFWDAWPCVDRFRLLTQVLYSKCSLSILDMWYNRAFLERPWPHWL